MELFTPYKSLDTKKRVLLFVLLSLCVLSLAFIFYNSSLPPEKSDEQSTAVGEVIEEVVDTVLPENAPVKDAIILNLRKLAHFFEFFMLGAEVALILVFFSYRPTMLGLTSVFLGGFVGFLDETVQIFSGRGPAILDVWIDTCGYAVSTVFVIFIYHALLLLREKTKKEE